MSLDDLLGPESSVTEMADKKKKLSPGAEKAKALAKLTKDLLGAKPKKDGRLPTKTPKKAKVNDLLGPKPRSKKRAWVPLEPPKAPVDGGLFALREEKGKNVGRTCINPACKAPLTHAGRGRPPLQCGKAECFRFYRNAYRKDYDAVRAA
jgi:hypothetical protein